LEVLDCLFLNYRRLLAYVFIRLKCYISSIGTNVNFVNIKHLLIFL